MEIKSALRAAGAAFAIASCRTRAWRDGGAAFRAGDSQHSGQVARCRGCRLCARWRLAAAHARKVGFHLRLRRVGAIESQVNDQPKRVYHAGERWYETPGSSHRVSRNDSATEPAKLLAVFVVDTEDKTLTTPAP